MSRSGYSDDWDCDSQVWLYRRAVDNALCGKRGQAFLRDLLAALDAMPEKKLIANSFVEPAAGAFCTLGVIVHARGFDAAKEFEGCGLGEDEDPDAGEILNRASDMLDIARSMAAEIMYENDEGGRHDQTPAQRWIRMRRWLEGCLK